MLRNVGKIVKECKEEILTCRVIDYLCKDIWATRELMDNLLIA